MKSEMMLGIVRHVLTLSAGYLVSKGYMRGEYMDTLVASLMGLAGIGWSMAQKLPPTPSVASAASPPAAPASVQPNVAHPPSAAPPVPGGVRMLPGLLLSLLLLPLFCISALAEGLPKQSKVWQGKSADEWTAPSVTGSLYLSVLGSYASADLGEGGEFDQWRAGIGIGYLAKLQSLGIGVDFDAMRHFDDQQFENEIDNWNFSARARLGYFITPTFMPFLSTGWARVFAEDTWTYGVGIEAFANERMSWKLELTKYELSDELLDVKFGVSFKF